jgi:hypothetical protein
MDDVEVRASPALPVADLDRAPAHQTAIGFSTSRHDDSCGLAASRTATSSGSGPR